MTETPSNPVVAPAPGGYGRAGRNLGAAIAAGVGLGLLCLVAVLTWKWTFGLVAVAALTIAVHELTDAFATRGIRLARTPLYAGVVLCSVAAYLGGPLWLTATFGAVVLATMFWRLRRGAEGYVRDTTASVFVAGYLPLMLGFVMLTLRADDGPQRIIAFIVLTICSDIGGYAAGVLLGKHPIAPKISPKKSWEGLGGSFALQAVAGVLLFVYLLDGAWWQGLVTGLVMTVVATMGDFAESAVKRDLGVKDMGTILPGHGGLMDRLDSLIPNAFTSWALFTLFLGTGAVVTGLRFGG